MFEHFKDAFINCYLDAKGWVLSFLERDIDGIVSTMTKAEARLRDHAARANATHAAIDAHITDMRSAQAEVAVEAARATRIADRLSGLTA